MILASKLALVFQSFFIRRSIPTIRFLLLLFTELVISVAELNEIAVLMAILLKLYDP